MGVRGRNSDNTMIREKLGWAPSISIRSGLEVTYRWIKSQVELDAAAGIDVSLYGSSKVREAGWGWIWGVRGNVRLEWCLVGGLVRRK